MTEECAECGRFVNDWVRIETPILHVYLCDKCFRKKKKALSNSNQTQGAK